MTPEETKKAIERYRVGAETNRRACRVRHYRATTLQVCRPDCGAGHVLEGLHQRDSARRAQRP